MRLTQINGKTDSRRIQNVKGHERAIVASGYSPEGYDNTVRRTIKERFDLGCRQVVVERSESGESWVCTEINSGETRLFPATVDPEWAGEMAAAEFAGEFE